MLVRGAVLFPQHHSLHRLSCPHGTVSPPLSETNRYTSVAFFLGSPFSSMDLCGCLVCLYHDVWMMAGWRASWKSGGVGSPKSVLLSEERIDTL